MLIIQTSVITGFSALDGVSNFSCGVVLSCSFEDCSLLSGETLSCCSETIMDGKSTFDDGVFQKYALKRIILKCTLRFRLFS